VGGGALAGYVAGPWLADKIFGAGKKNDWPIDAPRNRAAAPREGISLLGLGR
jgi:hypothetical protein